MSSQSMRLRYDERGIAVVAALAVVLIMLPLAAFVALQSTIDLKVQHNLRAATEAFYVAEAGLEHALADLRPMASLEPLLHGPDLTPTTADDGVYPFAAGPPAAFPQAPWRYRVEVLDAGRGAILIRSRGEGTGGALRILETRVHLEETPFTPAALYSSAGVVSVAGQGRVSGFDHTGGERTGSLETSQPPLPGIGVPVQEEAERLRARLTVPAGTQVTGAGEAPSVAGVEPFGVDAVVDALRQDPGVHRIPAPLVPLDWAPGANAGPVAAAVAGDLQTSGRLRGHGVLLVDGSWQVSGDVSWSGLVVVFGDVVFAPGSRVAVHGALWQAGARSSRIALAGDFTILYSSAALRRAASAVPQGLPRAPRAVAWREIL